MTAPEFMGIASAFIGPLVGVFMAWMLTRKDQHTDSVHKVFAKIFSDAQNYRHQFARLYGVLTTPVAHQPAFGRPYDPVMELRLQETELNTDCLMLGLLFGTTADRAGAAIQTLISFSEVLARGNGKPLPEWQLCQQKLNQQVQMINDEIRKLHSELNRPDFAAPT